MAQSMYLACPFCTCIVDAYKLGILMITNSSATNGQMLKCLLTAPMAAFGPLHS